MKEGISKRQATRKKGNRTSLLNTTRNKKGNENQKTKRILTKDKGKKKIDEQELAPRKSLKEQGQHLKAESESVMQSEISEELQEGTSTPTKALTKTTSKKKPLKRGEDQNVQAIPKEKQNKSTGKRTDRKKEQQKNIKEIIPVNETDREKVQYIMLILNSLYPNPPVPLDHFDAFTLLIAVILSK